MLTGKLYDVLKLIAMVVLPALATLYLGLGNLWNWPSTDEVDASIVLLNTFLGALLQLNARSYYKDDSNYDGFLSSNSNDPDTGLPNLKMTITKLPDEILSENVIRLKVG